MKKLWGKNIFDYITEDRLDDAALAKRMKIWMASGNPRVVSRAIRLYDKMPADSREALSKNGLTNIYVEKYR